MKDGELIADGNIARRGDSNLPEESIVINQSQGSGIKANKTTKKYYKKTNSFDALADKITIIGELYNQALQDAKKAQWSIEEFDQRLANIKKVYSASGVPLHILSAIEKVVNQNYVEHVCNPSELEKLAQQASCNDTKV